MHFGQSLRGMTVVVFTDNSTSLSYVGGGGGGLFGGGGGVSPWRSTRRCNIFSVEQSMALSLVLQFIVGAQNSVADSLSFRRLVLGSEWTLAQEVVHELVARWPATVDVFATALNYWPPLYFSPLSSPMAAGTDAFLQDWDGLQAYAIPPFALTRQDLNKLTSSTGTYLTLIALSGLKREWFPVLRSLAVALPVLLPTRRDLLRQPHFHHLHQNLHVPNIHAWRLFSCSHAT